MTWSLLAADRDGGVPPRRGTARMILWVKRRQRRHIGNFFCYDLYNFQVYDYTYV